MVCEVNQILRQVIDKIMYIGEEFKLSSLKLFEITNLFHQFDVRLPFDNSVNIFLGENGMGKTTILNCIYYVLSGQIDKLSSISFDSIKVTFDDEVELEISIDDVISFNEYNTGAYRRHGPKIENIFTEKELELLKGNMIDHYEEKHVYQKFCAKISDVFGMPLPMAERELNRYIRNQVKKNNGDYKKAISFKKQIEEKVTEDVLYFPTYRRIEEDLSKLGIGVDRDEVKDKLIQFGMTDVESVIGVMLAKIKSVAITGFTKMTGILLKQYLQGNLALDPQYKVDKEKLGIALDRIGDEIESADKNRIKELVRTNSIYNSDNIYLLNLIKNLITSYEKQNEYDNRVKNFANTCNKYLNGKEYRYDESNVTLNIYRKNSKSLISIQNLSSGEKQVISMFSKLYLEKDEKCIILFDEPELSLSIKWQMNFLPDITKSEKCSMLIAVTHSPFIFDNEFDCLAQNMGDCLIDKYLGA